MPSGSRDPELCWGITRSHGGLSGPGPLALATSLGAAPATPSHPGSRTQLRPFSKPPDSETFCVSCFLCRGERGLQASGALRGLRRGHWRALQHAGAGQALGSGSSGSAGEWRGSSFARCSGLFPRSSKLHHSGNDDSMGIIQASASFNTPLS